MTALGKIGKEISAARKAQRLRQADLAAKAGVSRATVEALENGRAPEIGYSRLSRMLAVLGLELTLRPVVRRRPTLDELMQEREGEREKTRLESLDRLCTVMSRAAKEMEAYRKDYAEFAKISCRLLVQWEKTNGNL